MKILDIIFVLAAVALAIVIQFMAVYGIESPEYAFAVKGALYVLAGFMVVLFLPRKLRDKKLVISFQN